MPVIEREQRWLPKLERVLPVPGLGYVVAGRPGLGYPWPRSLTHWRPGTLSDERHTRDRDRFAGRLGWALAALHRPGLAGLLPNPYRGGPLPLRDEAVRDALDRIGGRGSTMRAAWDAGLRRREPLRHLGAR